MSGLGYYLKYDEPDSEFGECVILEYVYNEWENGYCSETYIIVPSYIYYENASYYGFTLDYLKTAKRIKRQKFNAVQKMIANCYLELEFLGMTGEQIILPVFKPDDYYYSYYEYIEEGIVKYNEANFYRIISVNDNSVTYQSLYFDKNNLNCRTEIETEKLEDFIDCKRTRWYKITEELFNIAASKIDFSIEDILKRYRKLHDN